MSLKKRKREMRTQHHQHKMNEQHQEVDILTTEYDDGTVEIQEIVQEMVQQPVASPQEEEILEEEPSKEEIKIEEVEVLKKRGRKPSK